jgi:hypothetical protein
MIITLSLSRVIETKIEYFSPISVDQFNTFGRQYESSIRYTITPILHGFCIILTKILSSGLPTTNR